MSNCKYISLILLCFLLGGCSTFSFAPPVVRSDVAVKDDGRCSKKAEAARGDDSKGTAIDPNFEGARNLIENYRISYSCAHRNLIDGRQIFEVPAALALAGGAAAAAVGAPSEVALGTGAAAATLGKGNSYYAPRTKAKFIAAALNAIICIKQEASGISAMDLAITQAITSRVATKDGVALEIPIEPQVQYFQLVSAALQNVDSVAAERLSSLDGYSPDALASEITKLAEELKNKQETKNQSTAALFAQQANLTGDAKDAFVNAAIKLEELQPKLRLCVMRAKAG